MPCICRLPAPEAKSRLQHTAAGRKNHELQSLCIGAGYASIPSRLIVWVFFALPPPTAGGATGDHSDEVMQMSSMPFRYDAEERRSRLWERRDCDQVSGVA